MGHGTYSLTRADNTSALYAGVSTENIFTQRAITKEMNPVNSIRECRDSKDHPETLPVIIALDVTGSMGYIPDKFIKEGMTKIMSSLYDSGLKNIEILFMGIGDHTCDTAPLQIGQFEANDQLLNKWLKDIYLEGRGGGNDGESYFLAWYYAARYTKIDSFEKRNTKGFLFTIGDEPVLDKINKKSLSNIFGKNGVYQDITASEILKEATKKYNVYHFNVNETFSGSRISVKDSWKQLLRDHVILMESSIDIPLKIAKIIAKNILINNIVKEKTEEMML